VQRLTRFQPAPGNWLAAQVAANAAAPAIVLDLRHNPGGDPNVLKKVLNLFFAEKMSIGAFSDRKGKEFKLEAGNKSAFKGRLIVLIDNYSHSAAEVFTKAVQETRRGIVVGQTSGGQVLAGENYKLPSGFGIYMPILDYRTAKGARIEGHGVQPDIGVTPTAKDYQENKDPVLERARQLLRERLIPIPRR